MALCKLEKINYGGKWPVSIKYRSLYSFKEGLILQCQSIPEMRRITHLHGSAHVANPLRVLIVCVLFFDLEETLKYLNIQKVWRKTQVYFDNVVKDILPVNFTKFLPLECCQMKTGFKTKLQCFFWECKLNAWTVSQWILKRLQRDIPVCSSYTCPKYWAL